MSRLQASPWFKGLAAVLLLICAFFSGLFALRVMEAFPYYAAESWQETEQFQELIFQWENYATQLVSDSLAVGDLPLGTYTNQDAWSGLVKQWEGQGNSSSIWPEESLTYVETKQYEQDIQQLSQLLDPSQTWFRFQVLTSDGMWNLGGNLAQGEELEQAVKTVYYASFQPGGSLLDLGLSGFLFDSASSQAFGTSSQASGDGGLTLVIACGVPEAVSAGMQDSFAQLAGLWEAMQARLGQDATGCLTLAALTLLCLLGLLWSAGHKKGVAEPILSWQDKIFFELYLAAMAAACVGFFLLALDAGHYAVNLYYWYWGAPVPLSASFLYEMLFSAAVAGLVAAAALTLRTLTARLKAGALGRTCLICVAVQWVWTFCVQLLRNLALIWRWLILFPVYLVVNLYLCQWIYIGGQGFLFLLYLLLNGALLLAVCWWSLCLRRLQAGGQAIAGGNYNRRIDTAHMPHDLKECGENLNNISAGLSSAVEEKMKSERFKAELITNVSHDLKTPLTSIINYVNLLKTTQQADPKAVEYIEVLDRKSQRLKKLTEDLVEASKASTGVLSVNREKIGMVQLIDQALGEWTEKLEDRKLTVVTALPEGETWVYADGRHLWRVIDNLLSNCAKYAMEGTRVYLDLERGHGQVTLSVKNISREPLNIPPDRLMERFVRGEESRTTEGSGLGLSIARSLTELQGGEFQLTVDGDLFKASVTLPQGN